MKCERCDQETQAHTMSMFSTKLICMACKEREKLHPRYKEAALAELQAVLAGEFNYQGVGEPDDLAGNE